ncbi:MAG: hypothetical protein GXO76_14835 [Calditrichaeota bacterium]|nr:hypothetical protein [Calditrichota bacterium]
MMGSLATGFEKKMANLWLVVISGSGVFVFMTLLSKIDQRATGGGANGILGLQFAFSADVARTIIRLWGSEGLSLIARTMWIDYIYPLFYATFLASTISYFCETWAMFRQWVRILFAIVPFFAALLDYVENTLHLIIFSQFPEISGTAVFWASVAASIKWLLVGWSILVILYLVIYQAVKTVLSRWISVK